MKVHLANSNAWSDGNQYIMGTDSEVHTNALFDIYPNDTTITAEFKGNTQQNGTPSPSSPVPVVGVGDLDGTAYKIPVEIGLSTQSIDLSAVQSVRNIKKLVLTGDESWSWFTSGTHTGAVYAYHSNFPGIKPNTPIFCTHLIDSYGSSYVQGNCSNDSNSVGMWIFDTKTSPTAFKRYLTEQYTNDTPVTVWYILSEPVTDVVNEPLQKIGDYADSISNISLTTTAGAKSFGVDTAVKPSEITLNFRGWHPKDPKESTGGEWS